MNPKQIVMLVVSIVVILGCGIWVFKKYREMNPKPEPMSAQQMYQAQQMQQMQQQQQQQGQ